MLEIDFIRKLEDTIGKENIKTKEPMKNHTSIKVGGPADVLVTPENAFMLKGILKLCKEEKVPFFIMGNGSNLVVRDKGIRGVVIKTLDKFNSHVIYKSDDYKSSDCKNRDCENNDCVDDGCADDNNIIEAEAGILLSHLSSIALKHGLSGLEFASGIPGTLGGAIIMNAGAYGGEMKDIVIKTQYMDLEGKIRVLKGKEHQFGYRTSFIQKEKGIVIKSWLKLREDKKAKIQERIEDMTIKREKSQPLDMPSAGSVFKRPKGYYVGPLIEKSGLKGYSIGGAQISTKHCGFIVNTGKATAEDIVNLITHIQETIKGKYGLDISTEIKFIGEG